MKAVDFLWRLWQNEKIGNFNNNRKVTKVVIPEYTIDNDGSYNKIQLKKDGTKVGSVTINNVANAGIASQLGTSTKGTTTKPIYFTGNPSNMGSPEAAVSSVLEITNYIIDRFRKEFGDNKRFITYYSKNS